MMATQELAAVTNVKTACAALAVPRATYYRHQRPASNPPARQRPRNSRRYSDGEREEMLTLLNSERFVDKSPEQVFAILAEDDKYVASARTMYRVLSEAKQVRERRNRRIHPVHVMPRLVANGPNAVWSWDISKLKGPAKGIWFMLYVVLDIFTRYVVGWMLAEHENAKLAQHLLRETMNKHGIEPGQLTVHQDRGAPMRAKSTMQLLDGLGVARSYNRPRVSNDNPFSESHFGTMKQRPELPERLGSVQHGRQVLRKLYRWYNHEHHHSGIAMLTPAQVHYGLADKVLAQRHAVRLAAYAAHPERFINGPPQVETLPKEVWINPPAETMPGIDSSQVVEMRALPKDREERPKPLGLDTRAQLGELGCALEVRH